LIAGNPPERRIERLRAFWEEVSSSFGTRWAPLEAYRGFFNQMSATLALACGVPGFFEPRVLSWFGSEKIPSILSIYDTRQLRRTLERLIDFDYLNDGRTRLTVGATEITTGNSVIFDSARRKIGPEHIMASGALPPGLPPIEIEGSWYWDGGVVSNTPLQFVLNEAESNGDLVIYQVDLFSARGPLPRTMLELNEREKDIRYSSRTRFNTDASMKAHKLKVALKSVLDAVPQDFGPVEDIEYLRASACENSVVVIQLIYRKRPYEGGSKDFEFSRPTMIEHWTAGMTDGTRFVDEHHQLMARPRALGVTVIDPGMRDDRGA
jgi:NTE family protein